MQRYHRRLRHILLLIGAQILALACGGNGENASVMADPSRQAERDALIDQHVIPSGVTNPDVIRAMRRVPRHQFVPEDYTAMAYDDAPLPIGYEQTVSQPSLVAYMVQALNLGADEKVLEIGTGSGYQAAVLAEIVPQVYSIEIVEPLATRAQQTLTALGYQNIRIRIGDGYQGWPEEAPFDAIIVTAAPDHVPKPLLEQLSLGGRLLLPEGRFFQRLVMIRRTEEGYTRTELLSVRFVPMTGQAEEAPSTPDAR